MRRGFFLFGGADFGVLRNHFGQLQRKPLHDNRLMGFQGGSGVL